MYQIDATAPRRVASLCVIGHDELISDEAACSCVALCRQSDDFLDSTDYAADTNLTDTAASATRVFSAPRGV